MNIVEIAKGNPDLSNLVDALTQHGLVDTLSGAGPFTVFAPNNAAFNAAGGTIGALTDDEVTSVLTYHVVSAAAKSSDLSQGQSLPTVFTPHTLTVDTISPTVTIKPDSGVDATVITADVMASNGVIHIVDA